ncbi:MAG: M56 family metallopeptidase [Clostridium sp.]|nr:M56 family metallopeptidase [Clostridium sp.]
MGDIFLKLLNMSITAGWFILAVLCIRLILRKIPRWLICLLWGAVAVRLICPFSIESRFSMLPSAEPVKSSTVVEGEVQNHIPSIDSRLSIVENAVNPMLTETFAYDKAASVAPWQVVTYIAGWVWTGGMVFLLVCAVGSMRRLRKFVEEAVCVRDNIYICDAVKSPFILGIARPRVYLSSSMHEEDMNYIIAHETAHLQRKDHWWKALGYLLLCIYWFHPLGWVAYAMFCRDIELACDEKAAKTMTFQEKKEYSKILLSCTRQKRLVMVCPLAFGEVGVKERVKAVLNNKKPALWMIAAAAAVCVVLAICFLTNPTKKYPVRITIPAGSTQSVCYSDAEISPKGDTLTIYAGEGLGDTEIKLLPVEANEENAYDETPYITQGMPVKIDVEKGAWFKIGVNVQNQTGESRDVYVSVENVEVRIASGKSSGQTPDGKAAAQEGNLEKNSSSQAEEPQTEESQAESDAMREIKLYEQPEADKVCIEVMPPMIREWNSYYYIPDGEAQQWLSEQMETLDVEGNSFEPSDPAVRIWEGHRDIGWQIFYQDMAVRVFEGGYLYYIYNDEENGLRECLIEAPELCGFIQTMLMEEIGYRHYEAADIKDIVSAKLEVNSALTGGQQNTQTITDAETLQTFEEWFRNAEYISSGPGCGNEHACLELALANGDVVKLSMATDGCPVFNLYGVWYDYRPVSDWRNGEFYQYFDKIKDTKGRFFGG